MKKLLIVAAMMAVIAFSATATFRTTKASADTTSTATTTISASTNFNIPAPATQAAIEYVYFPPALGPYCVAANAPGGQLIIINGATSVLLRFNTARGGWDMVVIDGKIYAIDPNGIHKLATGSCYFIP